MIIAIQLKKYIIEKLNMSLCDYKNRKKCI